MYQWKRRTPLEKWLRFVILLKMILDVFRDWE